MFTFHVFLREKVAWSLPWSVKVNIVDKKIKTFGKDCIVTRNDGIMMAIAAAFFTHKSVVKWNKQSKWLMK